MLPFPHPPAGLSSPCKDPEELAREQRDAPLSPSCPALSPPPRILKNWPERNVKLIVATDGESMGSVGDVGVQAIGGPISKLSLYTACAGVAPAVCLPVCIDMGTDNEELLMSPFYVGVRHRCGSVGCEPVWRFRFFSNRWVFSNQLVFHSIRGSVCGVV